MNIHDAERQVLREIKLKDINNNSINDVKRVVFNYFYDIELRLEQDLKKNMRECDVLHNHKIATKKPGSDYPFVLAKIKLVDGYSAVLSRIIECKENALMLSNYIITEHEHYDKKEESNITENIKEKYIKKVLEPVARVIEHAELSVKPLKEGMKDIPDDLLTMSSKDYLVGSSDREMRYYTGLDSIRKISNTLRSEVGNQGIINSRLVIFVS